MTLRIEVLLLIISCMLVTIIPRVLPLIFAEKIRLSKKVKIWLKQVPPVVISALFFQEILFADSKWLPTFNDIYTWAGVFTIFIGLITRNLLATVVLGILFFELLKYLKLLY